MPISTHRPLAVPRDPIAATADTGRIRRVLLLLGAVIVLSAADLAITVTHLKSAGMVEANPIAALLITSTGSAWMLSAYKILTVAICVGLLYRLRRLRAGEIAAWMSVAILTGMSIQWRVYSDAIEIEPLRHLAEAGDTLPGWHRLD